MNLYVACGFDFGIVWFSAVTFINQIVSTLSPSIAIYTPRQELDICDQEASDGSDFVIYKQIGPILIKNDLEEAKDTIGKRLEFITGEM